MVQSIFLQRQDLTWISFLVRNFAIALVNELKKFKLQYLDLCFRFLECKFKHFDIFYLLKLVSAIQKLARQKLWKMFFISFKKFSSFSRYSNFCIFVFPFFLPVSHCFRDCSKINLKAYDVSNYLNNNLITHFVWYLEKEKRYDIEICLLIEYQGTFLWKNHAENMLQKPVPDPFFNFGK